ncbi:MAG: hypothetical protein WC404_07110 [Candidatus Omnitrophota bacterium]|jgi:hypothetical protein
MRKKGNNMKKYNTGHTSGKWTVSETWPEENSVIKVKKNVLGVKDGTGRTIALCGYTSHSEAKANARLIAAAPELLSTLKWIAQEIEWGHDMTASLAVAKQAIAKAEGRT